MLIRAGKISDECSQTNIIRYSSDTQAIVMFPAPRASASVSSYKYKYI
jgi:hypothetical protein